MKKIKVGIDINEVLKARWLQFDRYYVEEFGEEGVPEEDPYVYDFFKGYKWKDTVETTKMLNEDLPEDINPLEYQVDEKTGEAPVDFLAFKTETNDLTAKEMYNRFMYEDYNFEINGSAPVMYKNMEVDVEQFYKKYSDTVDFVLLAQENWFSIPPALFFLSRIMSRFKEYKFVEDKQEMWDGVDILITTDPEILDKGTPEVKFDVPHKNHVDTITLPNTKNHIIKLNRPYNKDSQDGSIKNLLQINDLTDNEEFEKIIGYTSKKENNE